MQVFRRPLDRLDSSPLETTPAQEHDPRRYKTFRELLLSLERQKLRFTPAPAPVFGRCYRIPDLDSRMGLEQADRTGGGWHYGIVVGGTVGRYTPISVRMCTSSSRSRSQYSFPIATRDLPGTRKDGWIQLHFPLSVPRNRLGQDSYVGDLEPGRRDELWRAMRDLDSEE